MNWGFRIILAFIVFIGFISMLVIMAVNQEWHLVSRNYYEQEIEYQEQINRMKNASGLSEKIRIEYSKNSGEAVIQIPSELKGETISGNVHFFRLSDASLDKVFELNINEHGQQAFDLSTFKRGLWKVKISFQAKGIDYFDEIDLYL